MQDPPNGNDAVPESQDEDATTAPITVKTPRRGPKRAPTVRPPQKDGDEITNVEWPPEDE
jgi:hypothetical protein